jgi:hypothetical protein
MLKRVRLGAGILAGLLVATGAGAATVPGWSGLPEPQLNPDGSIKDNANNWVQNWSALQFRGPVSDTSAHYFDVPVPVTTNSFTVRWTHDLAQPGCTGTCLFFGTGSVRVIVANADGTFSSASAPNSSGGDQSAGVSVPSGGTVFLQVKFANDATGCTHAISRVWTS